MSRALSVPLRSVRILNVNRWVRVKNVPSTSRTGLCRTVGTRLRLDQVGLPKRYRLRTWLETPFCNLWLNWAGEIKGNAAPTNYYRILCVLGDDVLSCLETSRWEWSPVDSSIGCFRFVCCGRLRILHDPRMGENSKRGDQIRHLRDRFSHYVHIDNCRAACLDQETG